MWIKVELKVNLEKGDDDYIYLTFADGTTQKLSRSEASDMSAVIQFKLRNDEYDG